MTPSIRAKMINTARDMPARIEAVLRGNGTADVQISDVNTWCWVTVDVLGALLLDAAATAPRQLTELPGYPEEQDFDPLPVLLHALRDVLGRLDQNPDIAWYVSGIELCRRIASAAFNELHDLEGEAL